MLLKQKILEGIRAGKISLAFRKWKKPTVKQGSQIRTSLGVVEVVGISQVTENSVTITDAVQAGFQTLEELKSAIQAIDDGILYKIQLRYVAPDPRIELRQQTVLSQEALESLKQRVARLDKYSKQGAWTLEILQAIVDHPKLRASDLAAMTGKEKDWLKLNIRKLKNLGLTISHETGYEVSPLGRTFLDALRPQK